MKRFILPILAIVAFAVTNRCEGASGTWTLAGSGSWDTAGNWASSTIADGSGFTATFGPISGTGGNYSISVDTARIIGAISFQGITGSTNNFTISGSQTLTLAGSSTPTITSNLPSRTGTISAALAGTQGISTTNTSTALILSGNNTYSGITTVTSGSLTISNNNALGATGAGNTTTVTSNGTLILSNGIKVTGETINLNSATSTSGTLQASGSAEWAGSVLIDSGNVRLGTANNTSQLTVSGVIANGAGSGLFISGLGTTILTAANTYTGTTQIYRGTLKLDGGNNRLPTATLITMGGTTDNSSFNLNGRDQQIAGLLHSGSTAGTRTVTNGSATASTLTLSGSTARSFLGNGTSTTSITGNLSLVKDGSFTQTLADANSYTGNTTITAGTLLLSDNSTMTFFIKGNGVNNGISGTGGITLDGDFIFDLSGASLVNGNSWNIINVGSLAETFGATFTVQGFTNNSGVWTNGSLKFTQSTGVLEVVPEPSTAALLLLGGVTGLWLAHRRKLA